MELKDKLKILRTARNLTQEEMAEYLGISSQTVSKWERGLSAPDIMLLPELASIFNITIDELFGKKVDREPVFNLVENVPWDDDRKIRFAVYHGKKLMQQSTYELQNGTNKINVHFDYGDVYKIHGVCNLNL